MPINCPRCGCNTEHARFCWMCGWDTQSVYLQCDMCGSDAGEDGRCVVCRSLVFTEDDDEEEP
jgi:hypothetical protein